MNYLYKKLLFFIILLPTFVYAAQSNLDRAIEQGNILNERIKKYPQLLRSKESLLILDTLLDLKNAKRFKGKTEQVLARKKEVVDRSVKAFIQIEQKLIETKRQLVQELLMQSKQLQSQVAEKVKELEGDPRFVQVVQKLNKELKRIKGFLTIPTELAQLAVPDDVYEKYREQLVTLKEYLLTYRVAPLTEQGNRIIAALKKHPKQDDKIQMVQERLIRITRNLNNNLSDAEKELYLDQTEEMFNNLEQKIIPQIKRLQTKTYTKDEDYKIYLRRQTRNMLIQGEQVIKKLGQTPEYQRDIPEIKRQLARLIGFMHSDERWSDQEYKEYEGVLVRVDALLKNRLNAIEANEPILTPLKRTSRMNVVGQQNDSVDVVPAATMKGVVIPPQVSRQMHRTRNGHRFLGRRLERP